MDNYDEWLEILLPIAAEVDLRMALGEKVLQGFSEWTDNEIRSLSRAYLYKFLFPDNLTYHPPVPIEYYLRRGLNTDVVRRMLAEIKRKDLNDYE